MTPHRRHRCEAWSIFPSVVLAVALGVLALGSAAADATEGDASLWGAVLAPDGSRLPGAVVTLVRRGGGEACVVAGALGVYRATGLAPGAWDVTVESSGFSRTRLSGIELVAGERRHENVRLALGGMREEVTVTSGPASESLEAPALRESGARDIGAALGAVPGVWPLRKGGIANDVVLRGLQSRDLNVLVDGDRVCGACPNHMDPPPFHVDFAEVERVQVGKGPFDVRNQGSLGGIINLITREPPQGLHVSPALSFGSFGYLNPSGTVSWAGERASALVGFSWRTGYADRDGDGLPFTERANYRPESQGDRAFDVGSGWARLRYTPSVDTTLEAAYTRQEASDVLYPYLLMDAPWDDTDRVSVSFESRRPRKRTITLITAQAYLSRVDHWMDDSRRTSSVGAPRGWGMGTHARAVTWGGKVGGRIGRTTAGVELYRRYWDAETELRALGYVPQPSIPGVTVDVLGVYAEYSRIIGNRVLLEAGARYDLASSAADEQKADTDLAWAYLEDRSLSAGDQLPSGKLRIAWRPVDGLQLSLAVGHTARVPEPSERYFALRKMGADWVGDPGLRPSRNTGGEAAVAWRGPRATLRGSVFASRIGDFITVREADRRHDMPGIANSQARVWTNVDASLLGGEASFSFSAARHVFLSGDLSLVRGRQRPQPEENVLSRDLPEMPPLRATLGIRYDDSRLFGAVDLVAAGRQDRVNTDLNEEPTPGYGIVNAAAGYRRGHVAVTLGSTNLLDRAYAPHLSYQRDPFRSGARVFDPGRSVYLNVSCRF
ncbi:MAG: TonB-dependent receptor [Acidobacteriota bacterium]|jgi:iron complex outermembrane receptor protein